MSTSITGLLGAGGASLGEALRARLEQRIEAVKEVVEEKSTQQVTEQSSNQPEHIVGIGSSFGTRNSVLAISNEAIGLLHSNPKEQHKTYTQELIATAEASISKEVGKQDLVNSTIYQIDKNLEIDTPRPDIKDTFRMSSSLILNYHLLREDIRSETKPVISAAENTAKFIAENSDPLDYVLDNSYDSVIQAKRIFDSLENGTGLAKLDGMVELAHQQIRPVAEV